MPTILPGQTIVIDGVLGDWAPSQRIDYGDVPGAALYEASQGANFEFALSSPIPINPGTTFWFDTDQNPATGYQIFGFAGGAEYNVTIKSDGTAAVYTGGAGQTLVLDNIPIAYSSDHTAVEFAVPKVTFGDPPAMNILYEVNNTLYGPSNYSAQPYVAIDDSGLARTDPHHRIGIVFSQTTQNNYFSATAYAQLVMAVESQAMQAGIPFDLLSESDLINAAKLANYDALVFPSMANVQASQVTAITDALLEVTRKFGVGIITAGNFLTNDQTGAPLPGDSYARMKILLDATWGTGGFPADVTITGGPAAASVFTTVAPGDPIHTYSQVAWDTFQSVSGTGQAIATETVGGQSYAAALATQTGGRNVLFSNPGVMADNNLLWQAIDYVAKPAGIQVSLALTRFKGIVASRTDMDQSQYTEDVSPGPGIPGIYDKLLPIVAQWKQAYNFVGSYYVNIGNNPANGQTTNWAVSAPYYAQLLAMGNEIGTHSYTHPEDTNTLTPAQLQFEFQQSKQVLEQQMSAYLGTPFTVAGAAVPGAGETVATAQQIIQYFNYMTGGFSGVGAGYPGAFGFLSPDLTNAVYLAPNTSFDFTLVQYKNMTPAQAGAAWGAEWNQLVANAHTPIVLWPWHDYGPTAWPTSPPAPSPYNEAMFTDWIARAYASGAEFVTEADLASRIQSFHQSGVTSTVNGNTINVTVSSSHAGDFALDLSGLGTQVIQSVAGWYAYDSDSLFLPDSGGSFSITTGGTPDDVTHITALPMRADLLSVTGDGLNLGFSLIGEGTVRIDAGAFGSEVPVVTGGTIASFAGGLLDITLGGIGLHTVSLSFQPAEAVASLALSADSGASASDFITNVAAQTLSGTLTTALAAGDVVKVSLDNGASWQDAAAAQGTTTFTLANVTLAGSSTLIARVQDARGTASAAFTHGYVLDQTPPPVPSAPVLAAGFDTGASASDGITRIAAPSFSGTGGEAGSTVTLREGATLLGTGIVAADGSWSAPITAPLADGKHSISATATDLAGNVSLASAALTVTIDTRAPAAPSAPKLAAGFDSGISATDNLTNIAAPAFTGTADAGSLVTLLDGTATIGTATAGADRLWSITASPLADGIHAITATATDLAGNVSLASPVRSVTIDTVTPAPSIPDMTAATDKGVSNTDNITNDPTPTFTGTAEAGSRVTLLDGAVVVGAATATAAGAWTITSAVLADGAHQISATAQDRAGNTAPSVAALAVTIDTLAPAAPAAPALAAGSDSGASATDNLTNVTTPTFVGAAEAGATVTLYNGATKVGAGIAGTDGSWSIVSTRLAAGLHSMTVKASDAAGNVSLASAALAVTIDTSVAAPTRPDLVAASDSGASAIDNLTNITTPVFVGTAEAGSTVTLRDGAAVIGTATAGADRSWTITAAPLADGLHSVTALATDLAGNTSLPSAALAVTIDTAAPAAPGFTGGTATSVAGTGEAGASVALLDGAAVIGTATVNAAGVWNIGFITSPVPRRLAATETDRAGNTSALSPGRVLVGTAGADTLFGSGADEVFIGGAGADRYAFGPSSGRDIIADFAATGAAHDVIALAGIPGITSFASVLGHASTVGTGVVIAFDASNSLTLNRTALASLSAADFTFA